MGDTIRVEFPKNDGSGKVTMGFECVNCHLKLKTLDTKRILAHHTCDRQLCGAVSMGTACDASKTTPDKIAKYKDLLAEKQEKQCTKASAKQMNGETRAKDEQRRAIQTGSAAKTQGRIRMKMVEEEEVHNAIFDFFIGEDIPFAKSTSPLFQRMVRKLTAAPPRLRIPTQQALAGNILDANCAVYEADLQRKIESDTLEEYGGTVVTDGATIQRIPMINLLLIMCMWPNALFLMCEDCTDHIAAGKSKDAEYMAPLARKAMLKWKCASNVDLLVTDGASDMTVFRKLVQLEFYWVWTMWCICHVCNNMMKSMAQIPAINAIIVKAKKVVAWFCGPHFQSALLRKLSEKKDLIQGCETRYGLYFLMLFRMHELRDILLRAVVSQEYIDVKLKGDDVKPIIQDSGFWAELSSLNQLMWSSLLLLRGADGTTSSLSKVVPRSYEARTRIESEKDSLVYGPQVLMVFDEWHPKMLSDIAKAAYVVDS
jgi:hypothetical protein